MIKYYKSVIEVSVTFHISQLFSYEIVKIIEFPQFIKVYQLYKTISHILSTTLYSTINFISYKAIPQ